jgi:hypothetical protein
MIAIADLWLPILLAAVFVFVVSSLIHMVVQFHKKDYGKLPNEEAVLAALRASNVAPGQYVFPCATSMKEMSTPEMLEKYKRGPVGSAIVRPSGVPTIGKALLQWFVYCIVIGLFTAYVAGLTLGRGVECMLVFRVTATVSFLGYGLYAAMDSIWKGQRWGSTAKYWVDGLLYALVTGATFCWLWPGVS